MKVNVRQPYTRGNSLLLFDISFDFPFFGYLSGEFASRESDFFAILHGYVTGDEFPYRCIV